MSVFKIAQNIYRFFTPKKFRDKITKSRYKKKGDVLRQDVINYYSSKKDITSEEKEVLDYLKNNPFGVFPYEFIKKYNPEDIDVQYDKDKNLHYSLIDNKRLYIKRGTEINYIKKKLNAASLEQDPKSPHLYLKDHFQVEDGDVVVDIGVQEGNFALEVIEKVSKVYLFEADEEWAEALNATFEPWKDKVVIVNKFVADKNDDCFITLDHYFKNIEFNFLKVDVDGAEQRLLDGAKNILNRNKLKLALCTYHKHNDARDFDQLLKNKDFDTEFSDGFMLFHFDGKVLPPYLRRGLIRAWK